MELSFFYHESNLSGKIKNNYKGKFASFSQFKNAYYDNYKQKQLAINGTSKQCIYQKVRLLNDYYRSIDHFLESKKWITTQSKIRSSILEEFCGFLFKDLSIIQRLKLGFYNKKIYAGVALNSKGEVLPKTKDIDFCIGKNISISIGQNEYDIIVPVIALECKTWLDKTMFSEVQFTSQRLKQGTPNVKVYVIAGYSGIDQSEVPNKGQTPIDQVYLIGDTRDIVDGDVIFDFFNDISSDLRKITKQIQINRFGKLLPE